MAKEEQKEKAVAPVGVKFHFLMRSVIRTAMATPDSGAVTGSVLDGMVTDWINEGWKVESAAVVDHNESVYNVAVFLVRG